MRRYLLSLISLGYVALAIGQSFTFHDIPWLAAQGGGTPNWNGTPAGLGGLALRWNYTNGVAGGIGNAPAVINTWTDTVQGAVLTWNQAANQPIAASTGVLFKASTGARDALTNKFDTIWTGGIIGAGPNGGGTNLSFYMAIRQINNNFGAGQMPMYGAYNATAPLFDNVGAATTLTMSWNGVNSTPTVGINQIPIDIYMTWSNGIFWAWTNGIPAITALAWNVAPSPWGGLQIGSLPTLNPWHGNVAEFGIYTNVAFVSASPISTTQVGVSNLHWYMTNYNVLQTNGVNSIFP